METIISGSTGPIFAFFAPNDRYLFKYDRSGPLFLIPQGTLPWKPIKVEKFVFFLWTNLVCHTVIQNGLQYHNSDFKILDRMNFSTLSTILVTFGPETLEFTL